MTAASKRCPRCARTKPIDEFHPCATRHDRRQGYCHDCAKTYMREWRNRPKDQNR